MHSKLTPRMTILVASVPAVLALAAALTSQYAFGLHPCELCIFQRWPYGIVLALGGLTSLWIKNASAAKWMLLLLAVLYLLDAGIAAYHAGVEWGIFEGLDTCSAGALPPGASLEEVRRQLMEAPIVSCRDPMFLLLGLSMAGWNVLYALGAVVFCILLWRKLS